MANKKTDLIRKIEAKGMDMRGIMNKINIKMDEVCGIVRKGKCYMSEAKRIKARKKRKNRK